MIKTIKWRKYLILTVFFTVILCNIFTITAHATSTEITDFSVVVNDSTADKLTDNNIYTSITVTSEDSVVVSSDEDFSQIYIKWGEAPEYFTITTDDLVLTAGENQFRHQLVVLEKETNEITITLPETTVIKDIFIYRTGDLPKDVQQWQPALTECDILLFPTHADDDALYMGTLIAEYAAKGKEIQLAFLTNHNETVDRNHELLDGVWEMGVTAYPIIADFPDLYSDSLSHALTIYNNDDILAFLVNTIRQCKPYIVVGHDENGEYGHGVHMLNTHFLKEAILLSNDETYLPDTAATLGTHQTQKTYLHLYKENQIYLDVHQVMEALDNRSPFEVAKAAFDKHKSQHIWDLAVTDKVAVADCRLFGLYHSTVGYDISTNDIFTDIVPRVETVPLTVILPSTPITTEQPQETEITNPEPAVTVLPVEEKQSLWDRIVTFFSNLF